MCHLATPNKLLHLDHVMARMISQLGVFLTLKYAFRSMMSSCGQSNGRNGAEHPGWCDWLNTVFTPGDT